MRVREQRLGRRADARCGLTLLRSVGSYLPLLVTFVAHLLPLPLPPRKLATLKRVALLHARQSVAIAKV